MAPAGPVPLRQEQEAWSKRIMEFPAGIRGIFPDTFNKLCGAFRNQNSMEERP